LSPGEDSAGDGSGNGGSVDAVDVVLAGAVVVGVSVVTVVAGALVAGASAVSVVVDAPPHDARRSAAAAAPAPVSRALRWRRGRRDSDREVGIGEV